ncbi:MAG: radical SAM protein, partial [Candidatus Hodarchaeota archaeon]
MPNKKNTILRKLGISYIKRLFRVIKGAVFVSIFFTRKCNLDCYYCASSKNIKKENISLNKWKSIINQIHSEGCRFITIYGGEPTLRSDLGELLKHCIDLNIFTHVVTNGTLLTESLLEEFASHGYFILGISIDGFKETNISPKKYRPELIQLLHKIKKKYPDNIDYCIHIVPTKQNIYQLIPLIKVINTKLECRFSIDPVHSSMNPDEKYQYRSYCPDLVLRKEEMEQLRKRIQNLKRLGIQTFSPNTYYYYLNKWYHKRYFWKCDAGDLYYAIDNDGSVMLCEDVDTSIPFNDFIKLSHKKRVKKIKQFKFEYCNCFKPCYWNPSNFIKHPIRNFIYQKILK